LNQDIGAGRKDVRRTRILENGEKMSNFRINEFKFFLNLLIWLKRTFGEGKRV